MESKSDNEKYCSECAAIINVKAEICPKCGVRQMGVPKNSGRSKLAAGLIAIFLGFIGIHKFYLGRSGWGIIYLVFFWTWIPALVGLVEGIIYLCMSDENFDATYNSTSA